MLNPIVIIGAGLSGLLTAYRLKDSGVKVKVLESRNRVGGRIFTKAGAEDTPIEMGATWFGPQHENMISLLEELQIPFYEQFMKGQVYFDAPPAPPQAIDIPQQAPSYRIAGGSASLIDHLASRLTEEELVLSSAVQKLNFGSPSVEIHTENHLLKAEKVICSLPPALLVDTIEFEPELPVDFRNAAEDTHTWMGEAVKAGLIYKKPFWKEKKVAAVYSNYGPVTEFYDHTDRSGLKFALCGFVHPAYSTLSRADREQKIVEQLNRLFGREAEDHIGYEELIWQNETFTKGNSSKDLQPHQNSGHPIFQDDLFDGRLIVSNSETSPLYGGYMEGAVNAANKAAARIAGSV